jgi:uncharacterized protein (DUF362 family)/Pyruvate/2-oxoacid:ferredoxin oxidoreductase delta subunit
MSKSRVSIIHLESYDDRDAVCAAVHAALAPLGGITAFVKPGDRVLLKVNLLAPARPEEAVTTHPEILRAMIREAKSAGASVVRVGDGPGVGTTAENMRACGLEQVCHDEGAEIAVFDAIAPFDNPENTIGKRLELTSHLLDTDVLITLPKLKTHVQMGYSGALKNQYGLIPGTKKAEYHFRLQDRDLLCDLMIDINRTGKVRLALMDAVYGMEGPGPHGGTPRKIGLVMASADLTALDYIACGIIGLDPDSYPLIQAAKRGNYGTANANAIEVVGCDSPENLRIPDFKLVKVPANIMKILPLPQWLLRWLRRQISERPYIDRSKCIKCLKCRNGCPIKPAAIDPLRKSGDAVNQRTCIRCYCCHEFCPVNAIELRKSFLERVFHLKAIGSFGCRALGWIVALFK